MIRREPVHCGILAADIEGFGRVERTDPDRARLRARLHEVLDRALWTAGVEPTLVERSDHGDCVLVLVDPAVSVARLLHPLLPRLAADLGRRNRKASPVARLRLRLVVHAGEVLADSYGIAVRRSTMPSGCWMPKRFVRLLGKSPRPTW
jgi:hypothetical protein